MITLIIDKEVSHACDSAGNVENRGNSKEDMVQTPRSGRKVQGSKSCKERKPLTSATSSVKEIESSSSSNAKKGWRDTIHDNWDHFWDNPSDYYMYYVYILLILMAVSLTPRQSTGSVLVNLFSVIDSFCNWLGLPISGINQTEWRTLFIEAYVALVCRSFTDLFVRRLLNPENVYDHDGTLKKFAIDSCFGGAGAACFVFLRKMALSNLK